MDGFITFLNSVAPFVITGLLTIAGTFVSLRIQKGLRKSEEVENYSLAVKAQADAAAVLVEPMSKRIMLLEHRLKTIEEDYELLKSENENLVSRLQSLEKEAKRLSEVNKALRRRIAELESNLEEEEGEDKDGQLPA